MAYKPNNKYRKKACTHLLTDLLFLVVCRTLSVSLLCPPPMQLDDYNHNKNVCGLG